MPGDATTALAARSRLQIVGIGVNQESAAVFVGQGVLRPLAKRCVPGGHFRRDGPVVIDRDVAKVASVPRLRVRTPMGVGGRVEVIASGGERLIFRRIAGSGLVDVDAVLARGKPTIFQIGDGDRDSALTFFDRGESDRLVIYIGQRQLGLEQWSLLLDRSHLRCAGT